MNMDRTSGKLSKYAKCIKAARKGREKYMNNLKESFLNDARKGTRDTTNRSNETTSRNTNASHETTSPTTGAITIRSNGAYTYNVGTLVVLAIDVCAFFCI